MKMAVFKAVCPLEIGDKVAIKVSQAKGEAKEAYWLPADRAVVISGTAAVHTVTDIATLHFLKKGDVSFMYELDESGKYEPLAVKLPVAEYDAALKARNRR